MKTPRAAATSEQVEQKRRFRWLRMLIDDDRRRQRLLFMLSLLSLLIVSIIAFFAETIRILPVDVATTRELQEVTDQTFLSVMVFLSLFGYMPWSLVTVVAGFVLVSLLLGWRSGAYLVLLTVIEWLANESIKIVIGRPRPVSELVNVFVPVAGNSFPSGHVMFYTVFFGFLLFLGLTQLPTSIWRTIGLVLLASLIVLIGPSRMYLGAHWLSDVIAAHLLGLIILTFGIEFYLLHLAPRVPAQQEGLIGGQDQMLDQQAP